ncbi:hypothetical protein [Roseovarius sp. 2305UL8-3]|uniref:hypothetical protein n=1 Tax=Roseovarius conchicola TaxID=3121636 RepID=UPI0035295406
MNSLVDASPRAFEVLNFCATHRAPLMPLSDDTICLEIGDPGTLDRTKYPQIINCFDEAPETHPYRRELALVAALIAASRFLQRTKVDPETLVNFMTYRLFVMPFKTEHHAAPAQLNFLTPDEVGAYQEHVSPAQASTPFLLPFFFHRERIEVSYGERHNPAYFPRFMQCAVDEGVLDEFEAEQCRQNVLHLTAMGAGRMPARVFCDISDKAEQVVFRFLRDFTPARADEESFQVALYLYERLAVYLLEKHIRDQYAILPRHIFGYWTLVDENRQHIAGSYELG